MTRMPHLVLATARQLFILLLLAAGCEGASIGQSLPAGSNTMSGWVPAGRLNVARVGHTATLLRNGKVLIVGGIRTNVPDPEFLVDAELYDPKSGSWSPTASSAQPRAGHTATLLQDGRVLVAGGVGQEIRISHGVYTPVLTTSAEIYDPATETWSATANLITARSGTAILLKSGKVLASRRFDRQEPLLRKEVGLIPGALSRILAEELTALFADLK